VWERAVVLYQRLAARPGPPALLLENGEAARPDPPALLRENGEADARCPRPSDASDGAASEASTKAGEPGPRRSTRLRREPNRMSSTKMHVGWRRARGGQ
jgi:hypothetical protein